MNVKKGRFIWASLQRMQVSTDRHIQLNLLILIGRWYPRRIYITRFLAVQHIEVVCAGNKNNLFCCTLPFLHVSNVLL